MCVCVCECVCGVCRRVCGEVTNVLPLRHKILFYRVRHKSSEYLILFLTCFRHVFAGQNVLLFNQQPGELISARNT